LLPNIVKQTGGRGVTGCPVVVVQLPFTHEQDADFGSLTVTPLQVTVTCAIAGAVAARTARTATAFLTWLLKRINFSSDWVIKLSRNGRKDAAGCSPSLRFASLTPLWFLRCTLYQAVFWSLFTLTVERIIFAENGLVNYFYSFL
jgi:hypothetical protein